jgi:hypothetical protein
VNEPSAELGRLRTLVATEHGLSQDAARLLIGETLGELEASADKLATLIGDRREQESAITPGPFSDMAAARAERKRALALIFSGRAPQRPQQRDQRGRFAATAADFSAGARQSVPRPPPTHDEWLVDVLRRRRADVGACFLLHRLRHLDSSRHVGPEPRVSVCDARAALRPSRAGGGAVGDRGCTRASR